jgi:hypothetical protein
VARTVLKTILEKTHAKSMLAENSETAAPPHLIYWIAAGTEFSRMARARNRLPPLSSML